MKKVLIPLLAVLLFASCKNENYSKTKSGLLYKIYSTSKDSVVKPGHVIKLNYTVKLGSNDSVINTSYGKMPAFARVEASPGDIYNPAEIFPMLRKGDSVVIVQFIDSLQKKTPSPLPAFLKKGDKIVTTFKVTEVFKDETLARADNEAEMAKEQVRLEGEMEKELVKSAKEMEDWLKSKNINAQKTGKGTYVIVTDPGTGLQADTGKYVTVRYSGKTLDGKEFESTMNPQSQPYIFIIGTNGAIRGFDEGLQLFKKGGKGTLYVPGPLAYGHNPPPNSNFKPNEPLIFDIVMVDVSATPPMDPNIPQLDTPSKK